MNTPYLPYHTVSGNKYYHALKSQNLFHLFPFSNKNTGYYNLSPFKNFVLKILLFKNTGYYISRVLVLSLALLEFTFDC